MSNSLIVVYTIIELFLMIVIAMGIIVLRKMRKKIEKMNKDASGW